FLRVMEGSLLIQKFILKPMGEHLESRAFDFTKALSQKAKEAAPGLQTGHDVNHLASVISTVCGKNLVFQLGQLLPERRQYGIGQIRWISDKIIKSEGMAG